MQTCGIITTYPECDSRNVGDNLITDSAIPGDLLTTLSELDFVRRVSIA
jgi:predicted regulator of amino acid metabolism with ACT domain